MTCVVLTDPQRGAQDNPADFLQHYIGAVDPGDGSKPVDYSRPFYNELAAHDADFTIFLLTMLKHQYPNMRLLREPGLHL